LFADDWGILQVHSFRHYADQPGMSIVAETHPTQQELADYSALTAPEDTIQTVEEHIVDCAECAKAIAELVRKHLTGALSLELLDPVPGVVPIYG
jgi:hypothetical protein